MLTDIGPRAFHKATAVATLSFQPQLDRAAIIRKILLTGISASDTWVITIAGQEVGRFYEQTDGNQQLLGGTTAAYPKNQDIFDFLRVQYGVDLIYPVPLGMTFTIASVGGATANIALAYTEHAPAEIQAGLVNHPNGHHFIAPIYGSRAAAVGAAGEVTFDTQVGLSFMPNIFVDNNIPEGWQIDIMGLFLEAAGVNTYSGAADYQSVTDHLALSRNGQQLFTRDALDGIPLVGAAAAAGSANTVINAVLSMYPPFQLSNEYDWSYFDGPLTIKPGDLFKFRLGITGDVTGNADYSTAVMAVIADIKETNL